MLKNFGQIYLVTYLRFGPASSSGPFPWLENEVDFGPKFFVSNKPFATLIKSKYFAKIESSRGIAVTYDSASRGSGMSRWARRSCYPLTPPPAG